MTQAYFRTLAALAACSLALLAACGQPATPPAAAAPTAALSATSAPPAASSVALPPPKDQRSAAQLKIESNLLAQVTTQGSDKSAKVDVDISANINDNLLARLKALGAEVISADVASHSIRARVPLGQIETIAGDADIIFIQPALAPTTNY